MKSPALRTTARLLIACLAVVWLPVAPVHAALMGTETALIETRSTAERDRIREFLQRDDVVVALQKNGVDQRLALARVEAMTDAEVAQLSERLDQLPAGGNVLGVLFAVFIILLVTDILGLTKVFPFTRAVR